MRTIFLKRKDNFNPKDYVYRTALESDYSKLIKEDVTLIDEDTKKIIAVYFIIPKVPKEIIQALFKIKYVKDKRLKGLITNSRIFGWRPREVIRNDFCAAASLASQSPKEHTDIINFGKILTKYYKKFCPSIYKEHKKITETKILKKWQIEDTPFSSGIINKENALHYHFDSGNFVNVYSNQVGFRSNIKGGFLSIPEYDIGLEIGNKSVVLFDGQKILHGVTPIKKIGKHAYRYTIVYYTLKQMWNCEPLNIELARIKARRTSVEQKRYKRLTGEIPNTIGK